MRGGGGWGLGRWWGCVGVRGEGEAEREEEGEDMEGGEDRGEGGGLS